MGTRASLVFAFCAVAAAAQADWLIDHPVGHKVPFQVAKLEYGFDLKSRAVDDLHLGYGIGTAFDVSVHRTSFAKALATVNATYAYIAPVPGLSPGIALGCEDLTNQSADGRRPYAAISYLADVETEDGTLSGDVNFGFNWTKSFHGFASVAMPLTRQTQFLAEVDSRKLVIGFGQKFEGGVTARLLVREHQLMLGFQLQRHF